MNVSKIFLGQLLSYNVGKFYSWLQGSFTTERTENTEKAEKVFLCDPCGEFFFGHRTARTDIDKRRQKIPRGGNLGGFLLLLNL